MEIFVRPVDTVYVSQTWPLVEGFIKEALDKGISAGAGNYKLEHIQSFLTNGQWLLVVAVDADNKVHGAATISFLNYPLHRVAFITTIGGHLITNPESFEQFKLLLKSRGATKIQGMVRESMARLCNRYGLKPVNTLVETLL